MLFTILSKPLEVHIKFWILCTYKGWLVNQEGDVNNYNCQTFKFFQWQKLYIIRTVSETKESATGFTVLDFFRRVLIIAFRDLAEYVMK